MRFSYDIKTLEELGWAVLVAVVTFAAQYIGGTTVGGVTDWHAWIIAGLAGLGRVIVAAVLNFFASGGRSLKRGQA